MGGMRTSTGVPDRAGAVERHARMFAALALAGAVAASAAACVVPQGGSGAPMPEDSVIAGPPPVVLLGGTLVDGTGAAPVHYASIVIRGDRIECAGGLLDCAVPGNADIIDASGTWIIPGLIDAHVHYSQTGFADGRPDALDLRARFPYDSTVAANRLDPWRYHRAYLCSGVTAVFDVGGFPWTWDLRNTANRDSLAPHMSAAGPLLSTADHWLNVPGERQFLWIPTDSAVRAGARYVALNGSDALKVWFLHGEGAEDADGWAHRLMLAGEMARELGIPLIVHATGLWQAKVAVRAGAHLLVHSVEEPVDEEFLALARAAGTIYTPTLVVRDGYVQLAARDFDEAAYGPALSCVDPITRAKAFLTDELPGGAPEERVDRMRARLEAQSAVMAENLRRVKAAGIPIAMGTDAGNPLTLAGPSVYLEMEAMQAAGMTPMEVLVAATRTAAVAMGRSAEIGTIEAGKVADMVMLTRDPTRDIAHARAVELVVRGGKVLWRIDLEWR